VDRPKEHDSAPPTAVDDARVCRRYNVSSCHNKIYQTAEMMLFMLFKEKYKM